MTKEQATQYKKNYMDNMTLEFVCKHGRCPSVPTIEKWSKQADQKLIEMAQQIKKWS